VHAKSAFEAMMRGKKAKEREAESKAATIVANVTKLVCTSKSQSDSLNGKNEYKQIYHFILYQK
jgi:hypothetical protein